MITKELELKFLRKLEKYFEDAPVKSINQEMKPMEPHDTCGCFGSHIAKCYDERSYKDERTKEYHYSYESGSRIFTEKLSIKTQNLFVKCGPWVVCGTHLNIFSSKEWRVHPYKAIKKVIRELENDN